jgi:hypothetical protein
VVPAAEFELQNVVTTSRPEAFTNKPKSKLANISALVDGATVNANLFLDSRKMSQM